MFIAFKSIFCHFVVFVIFVAELIASSVGSSHCSIV